MATPKYSNFPLRSQKTIAVAMSGGVDSLCALLLLKEQGHELLALHAFFTAPDAKAWELATQLQHLCCALDVELKLIDLHDEFEKIIIQPFVKDYDAGLTPNPCACCNREIKFGLMLEAALACGVSGMATGHYAALGPANYGQGVFLSTAVDAHKDQSYFLSLTPRQCFEQVEFPLAGLLKSEVRSIIADKKIEALVKKESQDICFIGQSDYRSFMLARGGTHEKAGPVLDRAGRKLGEHQGLWAYTHGQRRGLGIAFSEPLYVLDKNPADNSLIVGRREETLMRDCRAGEINFFVPYEQWPEIIYLKARYKQIPVKATTEYYEENSRRYLLFKLLCPTNITAPGQVAAVYSADGYVLAGGIIC